MIAVTAAEMRAIDRLTIESHGVPGPTLMENAGAAVTRAILREFPHIKRGRVLVIAGKGNNGGDGLVIARLLRRRGIKCSVALAARRDQVKGDAALKLAAYLRARGRVLEVTSSGGFAKFEKLVETSALLVDALLGTGLSGNVRGLTADLIELINSCGVPVAAVDIPSGLDSDSGLPLGSSVQAELTVTLAAPKVGLLVYPGAQYAGRLLVADIGIPQEAVSAVDPRQSVLLPWEIGGRIGERAADSHKGTYGHLGILAGSPGKTGAAILCGRAAQRAGAGLVTVGCPAVLNPILEAALLEVMTHPMPDGGSGQLGELANKALPDFVVGKHALVIGPGMGVGKGQRTLVRSVIARSPLPVVVDADALNCLAGHLQCLATATAPRILTPHPGEMSRLTGASTAEIQTNRVAVARGFATAHSCFVVLKGGRTIVASPEGMIAVNLSGNPGLASGGTGDVLAGIIGALLAQGYPPEEAAHLGVFVHGYAADMIAARRGMIGLIASDLINGLPEAFSMAIQTANEPREDESKAGKRLV